MSGVSIQGFFFAVLGSIANIFRLLVYVGEDWIDLLIFFSPRNVRNWRYLISRYFLALPSPPCLLHAMF